MLDLAVHGERLVVHAPVQPLELREEGESPRAALRERVVQANLDVRVGVERGENGIESPRVQVVEQQAHAHAALRRAPQRLEEQQAGLVAVPDVVLRVDRPLRLGGEQHAGSEREPGLGQRVHAGLARMGGDAGSHGEADPGSGRVGDGPRLRPALPRRKAGATGSHGGERGDEQRQEAAHPCDHAVSAAISATRPASFPSSA